MVPATLSLVVGILLAAWRMPPVWVSAAGVAVCAATAAASVSRGWQRTAAVAVATAAVFLGAALSGLRLRVGRLPEGDVVCELRIEEDARMRAGSKSRQTDARIVAVRGDDGSWHRSRGRVRIYADTTLRLEAGERVVCRTRPRPFGADEYGRMMRRKGYGGVVFLHESNILQISRHGTALLPALHRRAVERIGRLPLGEDNRAVVLAVGTGDTSMLSRDLRTRYSRAGTAHLLALSGLHVGIVYLLINVLLIWMSMVPRGHIARSAVAVVILWFYVFSTGMPPSAIRAALMFSMLQIASATSADYSPINALAVAAFISLCCNAGLVFDAGFRLSYTAVAALIVCGRAPGRHLYLRSRRHSSILRKLTTAAVNFVIGALITGFVATAATAPLVSHLFGVIPLAGILAGPAAIVVAAATVLLTAIWIALPFDLATEFFGRAIDLTAGAMNSLSTWIAGCKWAALDIRLSAGETAAIYLTAVAAILAIASMRYDKKYPKIQ